MAYQYGSCSKRGLSLGPVMIEISSDVRLRRQTNSSLYVVEVYDYDCGWYQYSNVAESEFEATKRAEYMVR